MLPISANLKAVLQLRQLDGRAANARARGREDTSIYVNSTLQQLHDSTVRHGRTALHDLAHEAASEPPPSVQSDQSFAASVMVN